MIGDPVDRGGGEKGDEGVFCFSSGQGAMLTKGKEIADHKEDVIVQSGGLIPAATHERRILVGEDG